MNQTPSWAPFVLAAAAIFGALIQKIRQQPHLREQIKSDADVLSSLPEESAVYDDLLKYIEHRVRRLIKQEKSSRRNMDEVYFYTLSLALSLGFIWYVLENYSVSDEGSDSWLWVVTVVCLFVVHAFRQLVSASLRVPRDVYGKPIKVKKDQTDLKDYPGGENYYQ